MNSKLPFRPVPWRITFDTNPDDCNLHCIMCEQYSDFNTSRKDQKVKQAKPRRMSIELIKDVLEQVGKKGLEEIIPSTMGEPLLFRHFDTIIDYCHEYKLKLNLTTNGTFPKRAAIEWANRIVPVGSDMKISWNGAIKTTQEGIMKGTRFSRGLQNIRDFIRVRDEIAQKGGNYCRVTLQMTFVEKNIMEIPAIIKLASQLGVDRIKGHHLWVHFPELEHLSLRRNAKSVERWNRTVQLAYDIVEQHRLNSGQKIQLDNFSPLNPNSPMKFPGGQCPFLGQEAWISAEGRFDPCCAPDEERKILGHFGNLYETDFLSIWTSEKYSHLLNNYSSDSLCKHCLMRRPVRTESS